jgi:hypothetical protein
MRIVAAGRNGRFERPFVAEMRRDLMSPPSARREADPKKDRPYTASRKILMPTTIPLRAVESLPDDGLPSFCRVLLQFYGILTLVLLSLTAIEMHLGMYPGLTIVEAIFRTIGTAPFAWESAGALL